MMRLLRAQSEVIRQQRLLIHKERLEHARGVSHLLESFLVAQERGVDVTETVMLGLRDMLDEVARLEEHAE